MVTGALSQLSLPPPRLEWQPLPPSAPVALTTSRERGSLVHAVPLPLQRRPPGPEGHCPVRHPAVPRTVPSTRLGEGRVW